MPQRTEGRPSDGLSVLVIDEDKHHANSARSMLSKHNFHVTLYSSPMEALHFLENHAQDVDFVLAAVDMEELTGLQFLEVAREAHENLQVIMMSTETTMHTVKMSIELGARFLVKKPLDPDTMKNIWQHLDLQALRTEKIKHLFRGFGDETNAGQRECQAVDQKDGTKKRSFLIWTPYLQRKFLYALKILGEDARPQQIEILMNVDGVDRKHISSHLQKHRKRREMERNKVVTVEETCSWEDAHTSPDTPDYHPYIQTAETTTMQSFSGDTQGGSVYKGMLRALRQGTAFDESQYCNNETNEAAGVDFLQGDVSADEADLSDSSSSDVDDDDDAQVVHEIITSNSDPADVEASKGSKAVVNLVDYPDSEDDDVEIYPTS